MNALGRIVGRQTHADGREYVSFRIVTGTMPPGPWNGQRYELVPMEDTDPQEGD